MTLLNTPPRQKLVQTIQKLDDCYSGRFLDEIDALAQKLIQDINNKGGEFLHNLDVDRDSTDDVGALIDIIPSALIANVSCQFIQQRIASSLLHLFLYWHRKESSEMLEANGNAADFLSKILQHPRA